MARFAGPGVVRTIHLTAQIDDAERGELLRGVDLRVTYDGADHPSILVPGGDFFCDSFGGRSIPYAAAVMAKRPTDSWFCHLALPFRDEIRIELVNRTAHRVWGYGYVTAETMPTWSADTAYLHARFASREVLLPDEPVELLETTGRGHFVGCHLAVTSACPHFAENQGICEGNDEFYVDGETEPSVEYLGTEDFFGFSWNWRELWHDGRCGTTFLDDTDGVTRFAAYRFLLDDPVRFSRSLRARINYEHEVNNEPLQRAQAEGNGRVRFDSTVYWYQDSPVDVTVR